VREVVRDQIEHLLFGSLEPVEEVGEAALRLGEELGQPAKQLREDDPMLLEGRLGQRPRARPLSGLLPRGAWGRSARCRPPL
jgi:hypothetical protein